MAGQDIFPTKSPAGEAGDKNPCENSEVVPPIVLTTEAGVSTNDGSRTPNGFRVKRRFWEA